MQFRSTCCDGVIMNQAGLFPLRLRNRSAHEDVGGPLVCICACTCTCGCTCVPGLSPLIAHALSSCGWVAISNRS